MIDIKKIDDVLLLFIKEVPTLKNGLDLIQIYSSFVNSTIRLSKFDEEIYSSYKEFESWLDSLLDQEVIDGDIVALNFGLYETEDGIQLYISGSKEWDFEDDDWACNNDYFPEDRYPDITVYNNFPKYWGEDFELGLFLIISTTIIYANTYVAANPTKFPQKVVFATGFDDGDLYNFSRKNEESIASLLD